RRTGGREDAAARAPKKVRWQARLGSSIRSAPVLGNGLLYVTTVGGTVFAIEGNTGRTRWKFQIKDQIHSTPSFWKNLLLFGSDSGAVYAVDADLGVKVWEASANGEVWTSPVDRKSTRLNSSHVSISYAVFCLKKKNKKSYLFPFLAPYKHLHQRMLAPSIAQDSLTHLQQLLSHCLITRPFDVKVALLSLHPRP